MNIQEINNFTKEIFINNFQNIFEKTSSIAIFVEKNRKVIKVLTDNVKTICPLDDFLIINQIFTLMNYCFKSITTDTEKINLRDVSKAELQEFIDSMNGNQFGKIREFIESIPKLQHEFKFKCSKCKKENNQIVEGIANFLG